MLHKDWFKVDDGVSEESVAGQVPGALPPIRHRTELGVADGWTVQRVVPPVEPQPRGAPKFGVPSWEVTYPLKSPF